MNYEFSLEGLALFVIDQEDNEPDQELRHYNILEYLTAAKESWEYAADAEFREEVDQLTPVYVEIEEAATKMHATRLKADVTIDKGLEKMATMLVPKLAKAYKAGNLDPFIVYNLYFFMHTDIKAGRYTAKFYGGLTLDSFDEHMDIIKKYYKEMVENGGKKD